MTRVTNAVDFGIALQQHRRKYDNHFAPLIQRLRNGATDPVQAPIVEAMLEAHLRMYLVNALLRSLNWRMDVEAHEGLPNLVPERPVQFQEERRYLDYFGFETGSDRPLLIVETKHPASSLPARHHESSLPVLGGTRGRPRRRGGTAEEAEGREAVGAILAAGLGGAKLTGDWNKWLTQIRGYVRSVSSPEAPVRRVVVTNGEWLMVFVDPVDAFLSASPADPGKIICFESPTIIEARKSNIFDLLEHHAVLGQAPPLRPGEIAGRIRPEDVDVGMHAINVLHFEEPTFQVAVPSIRVAPMFLLRSRFKAWVNVDPQRAGEKVPTTASALSTHCAEMKTAAAELRAAIERALGRAVPLRSIEDHYKDADEFRAVRGVREEPSAGNAKRYLVLTGIDTHYLRAEPSRRNCEWHDWQVCHRADAAMPHPIVLERSVVPRSFFISGEAHHCAHRDVIDPKMTPVSPEKVDLHGLRSGDAFCEIYAFEQRLCCRTCVFERVCTAAATFRALPCPTEDSRGAPGTVVGAA